MAHRAKNTPEKSPKKRDRSFIDLSSGSDDEITAVDSPQDNRVSTRSHHRLKLPSSQTKSPSNHRRQKEYATKALQFNHDDTADQTADDETTGDQEYVVKTLLDHEETKDGVRFKVQWEKQTGDLTEAITWEPEANVKNCQEYLREYWQKYGETKAKQEQKNSHRSSRKSSSKSPKKRERKPSVSSEQDFGTFSDKSSVDDFKKEKGVGERPQYKKDQWESSLIEYQRIKKERERKKSRHVRRLSESSESAVDMSNCRETDDDSGFDVVMVEDDASDRLTNNGSKSHGSANSDSGFEISSRISFTQSPSFHGPAGTQEREGSPEILPVPAPPPPVAPTAPLTSVTPAARKKTVRLDEADHTTEPPGYRRGLPELLYVFELQTFDELTPPEETWVVLFHGESGVRIIAKEEAVAKYPDSVTRFFRGKANAAL